MPIKTVWGAPGTGKTYYLRQEFIKSWFYRGVTGAVLTTFRRTTADDIKADLAEMLNIEQKHLSNNVNTIHGVCYGLLGGKHYKKVIDQSVIKKFNDATGLKFTMGDDDHSEDTHGYISCYSWLKNNLKPLSDAVRYPHFRAMKTSPKTVRERLTIYEDWKQENGYLDFSDMLTEVIEAELCPGCNTLLVDEFQDLTNLQNKIFQMWSHHIPNIVIAGDPLQSIYGFMGGSPDCFNDMKCEKIILPKSRRMPAQVWECAARIAKSGRMNIPEIETNGTDGIVEAINLKTYATHEGLEGTHRMRVFHLVRSRYQIPAIAHTLAEKGILFDGAMGWDDNLFVFVNAVIGVRTEKPLTRVEIAAVFKQYPLKYFNVQNKKDFEDILKNMDNTQFAGLDNGLIKPELYEIMKSPDPMPAVKHKGDLKAKMINNVLKRHTARIKTTDIRTTISTIHGAKGDERDRVFLHTGITPTIKKGMRKNNAEEARVFYVGVTRTKNELFIVKDKGINYNIKAVA